MGWSAWDSVEGADVGQHRRKVLQELLAHQHQPPHGTPDDSRDGSPVSLLTTTELNELPLGRYSLPWVVAGGNSLSGIYRYRAIF